MLLSYKITVLQSERRRYSLAHNQSIIVEWLPVSRPAKSVTIPGTENPAQNAHSISSSVMSRWEGEMYNNLWAALATCANVSDAVKSACALTGSAAAALLIYRERRAGRAASFEVIFPCTI
jgi:hypothetical protein